LCVSDIDTPHTAYRRRSTSASSPSRLGGSAEALARERLGEADLMVLAIRDAQLELSSLSSANADLLEMAHQLLGEDLLVPTVDGVPMGTKGSVWPGGPVDPAGDGNQGARGVYVSLPHAEGAERAPDALHTDGQPMMLGMVALLADSPKDGGSFKIWPGSHRRFYPLFNLQYLLRGTDMPRIDPKNRSLSEVSTVSIHRSGA
jgi:hypothetical protein